MLFLELDGKAIATLSDMQGRQLFAQKLQAGSNQIDIGFLSQGIYLLRVGDKVVKVVKE